MSDTPTAEQIMDALDQIRRLYYATPAPSDADRAVLQANYDRLCDALDDVALGELASAADAISSATDGLKQVSNTGLAQSFTRAALLSLGAQTKASQAAPPALAAAPAPAAAPPAVPAPPTMNAAGFALLRQWEGCVLHTYDDADPAHPPVQPGAPVRGTLTIGYGRTGPGVNPGGTCTQQQAEEWLRADIAGFVSAIAPLIKVPLNDNQFSAFVCFAYNVGVGAFRASSALACANSGDIAGVPARLSLYNRTRVNGVLVPSTGLTRRRAAEIALWNKAP